MASARGVVNYLLRLGWSHGDEEIISRDDAVSLFDLGRVGKSPARFDFDKLADINSHYLREMDDAGLWDLVAPHIDPTSPAAAARFAALAPLLKERAKTHLDIAGSIGYLVHDGPPPIEDDAAGLLDDDAKARLNALAAALPEDAWSPEALSDSERRPDNGLKMKDIGLPLAAHYAEAVAVNHRRDGCART